MTALPVPTPDPAAQAANVWLLAHYAELLSRARAHFHHYRTEEREEAVAEVLAATTVAVHSAARRGCLDRLTAYWCVLFAARQFRQGRRVAGYSGRCVMSEAARQQHHHRITSLDACDEDASGHEHHRLHESLADKDAENPFDVVRREHDYPRIFDMEQVSPKARRTFDYLVETKSEGPQVDLAEDLFVTPGRITQLKGELATALHRHGYHGPLGRRN